MKKISVQNGGRVNGDVGDVGLMKRSEGGYNNCCSYRSGHPDTVAVALGLMSISVWFTGVVNSSETGAKDKISSSLKKLFIKVAKTVRSAGAGRLVGDDVITVVANFAIFKSKFSVSNNLSSKGSGAVVDIS
uniref:Uncharacterized protein n=1 Tax=Romanomermis culicivorax TaxID=13658 RepID=A0A915HGR8_ROMCU